MLHAVGDWIAWLGGVIGGLTAIWAALRWVVVKPLKRWLSEQIEAPLAQVRAEVTTVKHEVTANSGHSLKDRVMQTRDEVTTLRQRFDDHLLTHRGD